MTCSEFVDGFSEFRDGTASADLLEAARAHRDACVSCARYEEVYERGLELLQSFRPLEVSDDFQPRLQHRLYHVEDEAALMGGSAGSGVSGAAAFAIAVVLAVAAWSPVLKRIPEVQLSPIVVSEPEEDRVLVDLAVEPSLFSFSPMTATSSPSLPEDLWDQHSHSLLYEYSPLAQGYSGGSRLVRAARFD